MLRRLLLVLLASVAFAAPPELKLPLKPKSVRLAVIGDSGTGERQQYEVAQQMVRFRGEFSFDFVIMLGDNIYGGKSSADFKRKFEEPYRALLDAGVKFYASLGNHDDPNEALYKPFNMGGKRYYSYTRGNAEFFALDSNYMDAKQLDWLKKQLDASSSTWRICYFHHPLYSHGRDHGPDVDLRKQLEPIFQEYGVSVVMAGHQHAYERLKPQNGIAYFVLGNSGQLRPHNLTPSTDTAQGFDTDRAFGLVEISDDQLHFQIISRTGQTVDSGVLEARKKTQPATPTGN